MIAAKAPQAAGFSLAACVFAADQLSKYAMLEWLDLATRRKIELSPIFDLTMVWNRGVSFGLFSAESDIGRYGLALFALIISGLLVRWLMKTGRLMTALSFGCLIGGALGNMVDRLIYGAVVDFLDFSGLGFPWVFNVADAAINIGVALLVIDLIFTRDAKPQG